MATRLKDPVSFQDLSKYQQDWPRGRNRLSSVPLGCHECCWVAQRWARVRMNTGGRKNPRIIHLPKNSLTNLKSLSSSLRDLNMEVFPAVPTIRKPMLVAFLGTIFFLCVRRNFLITPPMMELLSKILCQVSVETEKKTFNGMWRFVFCVTS